MKKSFLLPVCDCSRRTLLKGIGVAAVASLLPGCTQQGSNVPSATTTTCGSDICIDLSVKANAPLAQVGGALVVDAASDTIMVIRTSDTALVALSAICTHAGCECNFDGGSNQLVCPCHGSVFAETGAVVNGPARRPLKVYSVTLANNMVTLAA
jgi:cytochrome b6-f complex iron-sulfur subunit